MSRRVGFESGDRGRSYAKQSIWNAHLIDDEELLWEGRPGFGLNLNSSALKTLAVVAIGMMILGPQILAAEKVGSPFAEMLYIPYLGKINPRIFLGVSAAWTLLWFFSQTITTPFFRRYMLSNQRAFIAKTFFFTRVKSYPINQQTGIEYDGEKSGSIIFAAESRRADNGKKRTFPVGFMQVSNAKKVYKMMIEIQNRAEANHG